MRLRAFSQGARAAVFGASGGIGAALTQALCEDPTFGVVYAGSRIPLDAASEKAKPLQFDLEDEASIAAAARVMGEGGPLDLAIVATGVLHDAGLSPEKTWAQFSSEAFTKAFAINATGPALIAKHVLPLLNAQSRSVFAALGARVGSIEDNRLGGWAAYRASKAALHQIVRTSSIELARRNPKAICVVLHPGTVDTKLSKPFQRNVSQEKLFTPKQSAQFLLQVVDALTPQESGSALAWDGAKIPF